jgi:hypothetical protein
MAQYPPPIPSQPWSIFNDLQFQSLTGTVTFKDLLNYLPLSGGTLTGGLNAINITMSGSLIGGITTQVQLLNTTASISNSTGSLITPGGIYIGANSIFNSNLTCNGSIYGLIATASQPNITTLGGVTSIGASNSTTLTGTLQTASQTNISSVGTLTSLTVGTGNITNNYSGSGYQLILNNTNNSYNSSISFAPASSTNWSISSFGTNNGSGGDSNSLVIQNTNSTPPALTCTNTNNVQINAHSQTTYQFYVNGTSYLGGNTSISGSIILNSTTITATAATLNILGGYTGTTAQLNYLSGITAGTASASGALVLDSNKNISGIVGITCGYITISGGLSSASWTTSGIQFKTNAATFTNSSTAGSGTAASAVIISHAIPTIAATNPSVTTTTAATFYLAGAPLAGTNMTLSNSYSLWINSGGSLIGGPISLQTANTTNNTTTFSTNYYILNDNPIYFRSDKNHYVGYAKNSGWNSGNGFASKSIDGPVLCGYSGILLGNMNSNGTETATLTTSGANATFYGTISVPSTILQGTSNDTSRAISCLNGSMSTSTSAYITLGQGASNNNQAEVSFYYSGNGSSSNYIGLGLYGNFGMAITGNKYVGIGTTTPGVPLDVQISNNVQVAGIGINYGVGNNASYGFNNGPFSTQVSIRSSAAIVAGANLYALSDRRVKTNIKYLKKSYCDRVLNLEPIIYKYKKDNVDTNPSIGIIAQQALEVGLSNICTFLENKELIKEQEYDIDGIEIGVDYSKIGLLLIPIIRDLKFRIAELEELINMK